MISGSAGRIRLETPRAVTRPSTDRLREALFSILTLRLPEARVLDLFAGSGALGIEALSRGARQATFVDHHRDAVAVIRENLKRTGLAARGEVRGQDVLRWLSRAEGVYDLVLADPPYVKRSGDRDWASALLAGDALGKVLAPEGMVVVETGQEEAPVHDESWERVDARAYGKSHLHFFTRKA